MEEWSDTHVQRMQKTSEIATRLYYNISQLNLANLMRVHSLLILQFFLAKRENVKNPPFFFFWKQRESKVSPCWRIFFSLFFLFFFFSFLWKYFTTDQKWRNKKFIRFMNTYARINYFSRFQNYNASCF